MDEEDGRPGARAKHSGVPGDRFSSLGWSQIGPPDVPRGVPTLSLPPTFTDKTAAHKVVIRSAGRHQAAVGKDLHFDRVPQVPILRSGWSALVPKPGCPRSRL